MSVCLNSNNPSIAICRRTAPGCLVKEVIYGTIIDHCQRPFLDACEKVDQCHHYKQCVLHYLRNDQSWSLAHIMAQPTGFSVGLPSIDVLDPRWRTPLEAPLLGKSLYRCVPGLKFIQGRGSPHMLQWGVDVAGPVGPPPCSPGCVMIAAGRGLDAPRRAGTRGTSWRWGLQSSASSQAVLDTPNVGNIARCMHILPSKYGRPCCSRYLALCRGYA